MLEYAIKVVCSRICCLLCSLAQVRSSSNYLYIDRLKNSRSHNDYQEHVIRLDFSTFSGRQSPMDIARALKDRAISPLASRTTDSDADGSGKTMKQTGLQ